MLVNASSKSAVMEEIDWMSLESEQPGMSLPPRSFGLELTIAVFETRTYIGNLEE